MCVAKLDKKTRVKFEGNLGYIIGMDAEEEDFDYIFLSDVPDNSRYWIIEKVDKPFLFADVDYGSLPTGDAAENMRAYYIRNGMFTVISDSEEDTVEI